jgi:hypothetical protein
VDVEHFDEFDAVRQAAIDGLRSGAFVEDEGRPSWRFVILPSFQNSIAWEVRSLPVPGKPAQPRLFRSCWRMDLDLQAFSSPVERLKHPRPYRPTVEVGWAPIDAAEIDGLVRQFRSISVPLTVADPPIGCDGTNYELEIGDFFCHARVAWWVRLPKEWEALGPLIAKMADLFETSWRGV